MSPKEITLSFYLLLFLTLCHAAEIFQDTFYGAIGGGNYSYYWLPQPGLVMLYLRSTEGDTDLYVSSRNLKPTFDIEGHELQSTTCGVEQIRVSSFYDRPIAVAVYGHPSYEKSRYELKVIVHDSAAEIEDSYPDASILENKKSQYAKPSSASYPNLNENEQEHEERSMFWTLLLQILQVLLDVLVD